MLHPRDVFEDPDGYWSFLTAPNDTNFEGQFFDRKEAGRISSNGYVNRNTIQDVIEEITVCVSAFANSNMAGGLLVLGISRTGEVKGIAHLNDEQRNRITCVSVLVSNQAAKVKFFNCQNDSNAPDSICLIYVPYTEHA